MSNSLWTCGLWPARLLCLGDSPGKTTGGGYLILLSEVSEVAQSCLTLCNPMDCSLPGSSIHGIFQARILECIAISFSRRYSRPRDWTWVSRIVGRPFTVWATGEAQEGDVLPFYSTIYPAALVASSPVYMVFPGLLQPKQLCHPDMWTSLGQTQVLQGILRSKRLWTIHMQRWR